jgi:hypothetical protein
MHIILYYIIGRSYSLSTSYWMQEKVLKGGFLRVFQGHAHKRLSECFLHAHDSCFSAFKGLLY